MVEVIVKKLSAIVLPGLFLIGIYDYFTNFETNNCKMTYMFEMPEYIPIQLHPDVRKQFPDYKLYIYGEGWYAETLRRQNYNGIPVLFIPGNAGSYKQVRSLASVAYRMAMESSFHFNYFSVDLNEEYSALYGSTLQAQTEFVYLAIKHILKLYQTSKISSPRSVILVGHSMGGVIARALFTLPNFNPEIVKVIFTQASPHQPIIHFDFYLKSFYDKVNKYWIENRETELSHVNFVSFGGGHRDVMVKSSLTVLPTVKSYVMDLHCLTSCIPNIWLSTDHNGIVWCKQLVMAIKQSMFDLIDHHHRQLNDEPLKRASILHYHFIRKSLKLSYDAITRLNSTVLINRKGVWNENRKSSWSYLQSKVTSLNYFAIPIRRDGNLIIIARNVDFYDWLMVCKANITIDEKNICEKASVISNVQLLPSLADGVTKSVHLPLIELREQTHIVVQVQPTVNKVEVFAEIYDPQDRHLSFDVPYMPNNLLFTSIHLEKTVRNAAFYNITLKGFNTLWQAYKVVVVPLCKKCKNDFTSVMRFHVPWSNEEIYTQINCTNGARAVVKLQLPKPDVPYSDPQLHFYFDPNCQFRITISAAFVDILGQIVRHFTPQIFILAVAILVESLSAQLSMFLKDGKCPSLMDSLSPYRIFITLVIPTYVVLYIYKFHEDIPIIEMVKLSNLKFESLHFEFSGTPLLFYFCAFVFVQFLTRALLIPVSLISYLSSYIFYKYLKMEPGNLKIRSNFPITSVIVSAVLISIARASCGSLILLLVFSAYVFKVGKLKGQFKNALQRGRDVTYLSLSTHIHFTLLILWFLTCLTSIPSLMVWLKNLKVDMQLHYDPSFPFAFILIASLVFCWTEEASMTPRWIIICMVWLLRILAICTVFFVMDSFFVLPFYICVIFMLIDVLYAFRIPKKKMD